MRNQVLYPTRFWGGMMPFSKRSRAFAQAVAPFFQFYAQSPWTQKHLEAGVADFTFGNPHEMPLTRYVESLQRALIPQNKDWFAYKLSEPASQEIIATSLQETHQLPFEPADVIMTTGGFAGISAVLSVLIDPGDEVIFNSPPWFFYEGLIAAYDGIPVRIKVRADNFDLDLEAIERAITPKTRAILVNSPNNPTGRIYPEATLKTLADILERASARNGRAIYLLSDEAYRRIIYDGRAYPSPAAYYDATLVIYSYGKTLLSPGQRIGYVALPPAMPDREALRDSLFKAVVMNGFTFPNALLQHALADLERLSIDVEHLQFKRDRLVESLRSFGYELHSPEGTFYLLVRSPIEDDWTFSALLADHNILCLPGTVVEMPGYFRLSLTANDAMIESALPGFEAAIRAARR